jgi:hypothetical protein
LFICRIETGYVAIEHIRQADHDIYIAL